MDGRRNDGRQTRGGRRRYGEEASYGTRRRAETGQPAGKRKRRGSARSSGGRERYGRDRGAGDILSQARSRGAYAQPRQKSSLSIAVIVVALAALLSVGCTAQRCACSSNSPTQRSGTAAVGVSDIIEQHEPATLEFIAVGDIVAHKEMIAQARSAEVGSYDFNHVFAPMRDRLASYDLASVTQETPLVADESRVGGYPVFGTPLQMGDAIVNAGFDVVVSATNHSMDQGADGILDTVAYWKQNHPEITLLGLHDDPAEANGVTFVEKNGIRIAMTDCTYGLNGFELPEGGEYEVDMLDDLEAIAQNVEAVQDQVDLTICYVHMGNEYATVPSDEQRAVAERLIDAGADVVLGSHVHVVQPMEEVVTPAGNKGIVYFSLGNFASNQADVENMLGGAAILTIVKVPNGAGGFETSVAAHEFVPLFCHYDYETTQMYFLDDYTDELASSHFITLYGHPFTVDQVYGIWQDITGLPS